MVRCYDCGQPIPDEQIVRRVVRTGTSRRRLLDPPRAYYRKVNLCPACSASRARNKLLGCSAIGGLVLMVCICGGIISSVSRIVPDTAQRVEQNGKQADARKAEADAVKPVEQQRKDAVAVEKRPEVPPVPPFSPPPDAVAAEKQPDVPRKDIQPPPPKPPAKDLNPPPPKPQAIDVKPPLPKPLAKKSSDVVKIKGFLGISPDFKFYAMSDADGVKIVEFETGKNLVSLKWARGWERPISAAFGSDIIAVVTGNDFGGRAVRIFSRKTGELKQNIHRSDHIQKVAFTANRQLLAIAESPLGKGYSLVFHDVQRKKKPAKLDFGGNGYWSLAMAEKYLAVYTSQESQIAVVDANTRKVAKKINLDLNLSGRLPLAVSLAGDLIACAVFGDVCLYDIVNGKAIHKLEGRSNGALPVASVEAVAFSPDGEVVASITEDKTICFWKVKQEKVIRVIKNPTNPAEKIFSRPTRIKELIFSTDGDRVAAVYWGQQAQVWSVELK